MPQDLEALRAMLDARLAALESALADPRQHGSLERLILDLAQVATEESEAAARRAYAEAQRSVQDALANTRAEVQAASERAQAQVAAERGTSVNRDRELTMAQQALEQEQAARANLLREIETTRAALQDERASGASLRQTLEQMQSGLLSEKSATATRDSEVARLRQAIEQEHAAHASLRRELEKMQATLDSERQAAAAVREALDQARASLAAERDAGSSRQHELSDADRRAFEGAQHALEAERVLSTQLRETIVRLENDLGASRRDVDVRSKTQLNAQSDLQKALSSAEERASAASRERDKFAGEVLAVTNANIATEAAARAKYDELRNASDQKIRELEAALQQAEKRAAAEHDTGQWAEVKEDETRHETAAHPASKRAKADHEPAHEPSQAKAAKADAKTHEAAHVKGAKHEKHAAAHPSGLAPVAHTPAPVPPGSPMRAAMRFVITDKVNIQIDGSNGKLIDLSLKGAQILSPGALKPNRVVKIVIPHGPTTFSCKGKIVWAKIDSSEKGGLWYRAGVFFTNPPEAALETFLGEKKE